MDTLDLRPTSGILSYFHSFTNWVHKKCALYRRSSSSSQAYTPHLGSKCNFPIWKAFRAEMSRLFPGQLWVLLEPLMGLMVTTIHARLMHSFFSCFLVTVTGGGGLPVNDPSLIHRFSRRRERCRLWRRRLDFIQTNQAVNVLFHLTYTGCNL